MFARGTSCLILQYIYGGGFTGGYSRNPLYSGVDLVTAGVNLKLPIIYVSFNYRHSGHGFLAGKEVLKAGIANIGLHDRELACLYCGVSVF